MAKTVRLKVDRKPSYKYNINGQIGQLPRGMNIGAIVKHLEAAGISRDHFFRDRRIPFGSNKSIAADRLIIYCKVFECTIEDLVNHNVKVTSIREALDPKADFAKPKRTGLK